MYMTTTDNSDILASNSIYVCINHEDKLLQKYYENLEIIFKLIRKYEDQNSDNFLETDESSMGLPRLN